MSGKFKFDGHVEITHLGTRKEGAEDDKQLAVDLKVRAQTDESALAFFGDGLREFLFFDDKMGAVRNTTLGPLPFLFEIEDYRMEMLGSTHYGVKLKKFTVQPLDGFLVELVFQVSFKPSGGEVAQIAEYLQEEIAITLAPTSEELDLVAPPDKMAELNDRLGDLAPDVMYDEAKRVVKESGRASISLVQRELRIGYNRASRLIEQMEADGVVSKTDTNGNRVVL